MTPLAWTLVAVALLVGWAIGRLMSRRPEPVEPPEDHRLEFERDRADKAEKKVVAQETEMRDWAASHKVLEAQVGDLQRQAAEAREVAESQPTPDAEVLDADMLQSDVDVAALEATITRLEAQIVAGAGSVTQADAITSAQQDERIAVLEAALNQAKKKIAELERRLDS